MAGEGVKAALPPQLPKREEEERVEAVVQWQKVAKEEEKALEPQLKEDEGRRVVWLRVVRKEEKVPVPPQKDEEGESL